MQILTGKHTKINLKNIKFFFRIANLGCGYQSGQRYVCCPLVADPLNNINSGKLVDGQRCGLSQVQGTNYNGIGAYPWIARVGFRSIVKS